MQIAKIMSPEPITVERTETLARALATMDELEVRHLPVTENGHIIGVVSDRDLLESTGWMWNEEQGKAPINIGDVFQPEPMTVTPEESVATLARRMLEWGVGCAPVTREGKLCGIVTEVDVLIAFARAAEAGIESPTAQERMTADVVTLDMSSTAEEARDLMLNLDLRHLPIVEQDNVLGMVSDRDVRMAIGRALPGNTPVREIMSQEVQSIGPQDDLALASRAMALLKIGALPVVDRGKLVGMLTVSDVLDHCALALV